MKPLLPVLVLFLAFVHRSPAPILEESTPQPSPAEKAKAKESIKPKHKTEDSEETKTRHSPFERFEGIWSGTVTSTATATFLFSSTGSSSGALTIRVSKSGVVTYGNEQPVQGWVSADGTTLNWNIQKQIDDMTWRQNCSLQLTGPKSGRYVDRNKVDGAIADVSGSSSGTLYRR
jgi:hypothetical protein